MAVAWPALNSLAWLRLPCCGAEHPTRVEDFVGNDCVIGTPIAPHTEPARPMRPNEGFFFGWVAPERGALEVPVVLIDYAQDPMLIWTIRSVGDAAETQRRNYVRLPYESDALLYFIEGGAPSKVAIHDISEGGMRCTVDKWAVDPGGRAFTAEVPFNGKVFFLRAQVAWWGNLDAHDTRSVGIKFINVETATADTIRSYIFAAQLEERRRRLA